MSSTNCDKLQRIQNLARSLYRKRETTSYHLTYHQAPSLAFDSPTRRLQGVSTHIQNTVVWDLIKLLSYYVPTRNLRSTERKDLVIRLIKRVIAS